MALAGVRDVTSDPSTSEVLHGGWPGLVPLRVTARADGDKGSRSLNFDIHAFVFQDQLAQPTMTTYSLMAQTLLSKISAT